ncbi:MAG: DUF1778 domain-containing protein [Synergistaceae bacterium]|jgi:uncharacterized protein (DUF1778 family)|nr:DUF1778 domain-containing protein [Synergistaceae bacterium]
MADIALKEQARDITTMTARVPVILKRRWQKAASLRGITLTDFLIMAANDAASGIFAEEDRIELSEKSQLQFMEMLMRPPKAKNGALQAVIEKRLARLRKA